MQSFEWGNIQEKAGRNIWRMWLVDEKIDAKNPVFSAQIIKHNLPFKKSYLYSPHGPIFRCGIIEKIKDVYGGVSGNPMAAFLDKKNEYFSEFLNAAKNLCQEENAIFFKIEPLLKSEMHRACILATSIDVSEKEIQPKDTLILDLEKSEGDILDGMKQKTRYNIRLAEKRGVRIVKAENQAEDFEKFWDLMRETAKRDGFHLHSKEIYKNILNSRSADFKNYLYLAFLGNDLLAGAIINFFNGKAVYLHGASSSKHRDVMAPYLLHWEIIKDAKSRGFKQYDFWGISEKWPGVTRFKTGFGGKEIQYLGAFDLIVDNKWYLIYSLMRKIL